MAALLVVAIVHTKSRIGGALATIGWCVAALVFGALEFSHRDAGVVFLRVQTPKWVFFATIAGIIVWNLFAVFRALSRRVAKADADPATDGDHKADKAAE